MIVIPVVSGKHRAVTSSRSVRENGIERNAEQSKNRAAVGLEIGTA